MVENITGTTRREFLKTTGAVLGTAGVWPWPLKALAFRPDIANPLAYYPAREWEKIYRDQYHYDRSFSWVCSPNDTHACRVNAYVRNGIVVRSGEEYNYETY